MAKIAVIDGLARSGTTLLSAILHSQQRVVAFRGCFHEPQACNLGTWPHGMARHPLVKEDIIIESEENPSKDIKSKFTKWLNGPNHNKTNLNWNNLKQNTLNIVRKENQTGSYSLEQWENLLSFDCKTIECPEDVLCDACKHYGQYTEGTRKNEWKVDVKSCTWPGSFQECGDCPELQQRIP